MISRQTNAATITRALRDTGITNPADRRAFIEGKDLKEKVLRILENNPQLQEELAHSMGIGDRIIGSLHDVMEKDFQEPDALLDELIEFFKKCGKLDLNIHGITTRGACLFHTGNKQKWVQNPSSLIPLLHGVGLMDKKMFLWTGSEEWSGSTDGSKWGLSFKITTSVWSELILSFGDKETPKSEIEKIQKLFKKTGLLQRIKEKLRHIQIKYTDHLTGLYNKHYIQSVIEKNTPYSVIFLDLDKFKEYNDTHGHDAGDTLLQEIAKILQTSVRCNDKVCRNGWDEFIIFIDGCNAREEIDKITGRIREEIDVFNLSRQGITDTPTMDRSPLSITSGYAIWDDTKWTLEDIIHKADKEMFKNKIEKGHAWGTYRIIDKISKLSPEQQREIIAGLVANNPWIMKTDKDSLLLSEVG